MMSATYADADAAQVTVVPGDVPVRRTAIVLSLQDVLILEFTLARQDVLCRAASVPGPWGTLRQLRLSSTIRRADEVMTIITFPLRVSSWQLITDLDAATLYAAASPGTPRVP